MNSEYNKENVRKIREEMYRRRLEEVKRPEHIVELNFDKKKEDNDEYNFLYLDIEEMVSDDVLDFEIVDTKPTH